MISFATLLLGLVFGQQLVVLEVAPGVETVRLELDQRVVATISGPPWSTVCDFGDRLQPHHLVASAYDADGELLESVEKWINLPRGATAVEASLRPGETAGQGDQLLLRWQNVYGDAPTRVRVTFDGTVVPSRDPQRFTLPDYDPEILHVVGVEVDFPHNLSSVEELTVGGGQVERSVRELTGIPVLVGRAGSDVTPAHFEGSLEAAGKPVRVTAVEEGPAQVVVVFDPRAQSDIERFLEKGMPRVRKRRIRLGYQEPTGRGGAFLSLIRPGDWVRFVWPFAQRSSTEATDFDVFDFSREYTRDEASFVGLLRYLDPPSSRTAGPQRLSDAVAVAGLLASNRSRRRAVIVVLGEADADTSNLAPSMVRDYLASLGVPLFVWATTSEVARAAEPQWGDVQWIASIYSLEDAIERVGKHLARQRIVWVEGAHLPQSLEAAPGSRLSVVR